MKSTKKIFIFFSIVIFLIILIILILTTDREPALVPLPTEKTLGDPTKIISNQTSSPVVNKSIFNGLPSFPGAEGFGSQTVGGRGGKIIVVSNLNDQGPGSFRAAIEQTGPRIIIFSVGGTIEIDSSLEIKEPFITIAGQTAPGDGITLKNSGKNSVDSLIISTHDVIVRYIRSRPGPPNEISSNGDALEILGPGAYNVIIDHCSFSWGIDEVVSTWYDAHDITIQWSIISEGLNCSKHKKGCHGMGLLLGSEGSKNISIHHNLFAHNIQRNPLIQTSGQVDFINNVIYNAGFTPITINDNYGQVTANIVGNYYKQIYVNSEFLLSANSETGMGMEIFLSGNISPTREENNFAEKLVAKPDSRKWIISTRIDSPFITTTSAFDAYSQVLSDAGSSKGLNEDGEFYKRQDSVDIRIIHDVENGTGKAIDDPMEVGGWPVLAMGEGMTDKDLDGMPDNWEIKYGFDPENSQDGSMDFDNDGYTNIEEYLNGTNPIG